MVKSEVQCCGIASFPYYCFCTFHPPPFCTCHTGYLQVDCFIMSEEFFKAVCHGIPKAEQQVIHLKKEFIPWLIYILKQIVLHITSIGSCSQ